MQVTDNGGYEINKMADKMGTAKILPLKVCVEGGGGEIQYVKQYILIQLLFNPSEFSHYMLEIKYKKVI